jgi:hypothetical protein
LFQNDPVQIQTWHQTVCEQHYAQGWGMGRVKMAGSFSYAPKLISQLRAKGASFV